MATNKELQKTYDDGKLNWHPGFNESLAILNMYKHWNGKKVLEIGCGEGHLASMLAYAGAQVTAIDYSEKQIKRAVTNYNTKRIKFRACDFREIVDRFDIVVMQGVLEHFDDPQKEFAWINKNLLKPATAGMILISVPHFWNPRGFIFHTLRLLLDAPMSLTDLHYFFPGDIKKLADLCQLKIKEYYVTDESWGSGAECCEDLAARIPAALPDLDKDKVAQFIEWLRSVLLDGTVDFSGLGATAVYKLVR